MGKLWVVVGDVDGIPVWEKEAHTSPVKPQKLATGAVVEGLREVGAKLFYVLREGAGPQSGWVFRQLDGGVLLVPKDDYDSWEKGAFDGTRWRRTSPPWKKWYSTMEDVYKPRLDVGLHGVYWKGGEAPPKPYVWLQKGIEVTKVRFVRPGDDFTPAHLASIHSNKRRLDYADLVAMELIGVQKEYVWASKGIKAVALSDNPNFRDVKKGDPFTPAQFWAIRQFDGNANYEGLAKEGFLSAVDDDREEEEEEEEEEK